MAICRRINSSGSAFSTLNWLSNHYSIKSEGRFDFVGKLPIQPGDRVLDLGCAYGAWTQLMAERVGVKGLVCGVDRDSELVRHATKSHQKNHLSGRIFFETLDIESDKVPPGFNIVTAFNVPCLSG